jgi:aminoacrylate peracid reductase
MPKQAIIPPGSPPPLAPYAPAIKAGNMVYVSGILAIDGNGRSVAPNDVALQTRHVLRTIQTIIETAGGVLEDIVYNAIFLKDLDDYSRMNAVYAEFFPNNPPARYCIRADLVKPEFLVEISSIAHLGI